ncbi:hypothetical protein GQ457_16G031700 [Hibiscus cannabinus]
MLRTAEGNMKKGGSKSVLMVREAKGKGKKVAKSKGNGKTKPKGKEALKPKGGVSKDGKCFHCGKTGHWKRNCPIYLEDVKKAKAVGALVSGIYVIDVHMSTSSSWVLDTGCGSHICTSVQGLHMRRTLAKGDVDLRVGNGARVASLAVGTYVLSLPSMLRTAEGNMKKGGSKSVLMVREAKGKGKKVAKSKGNGKTKPKGKEALKPKGGVSKDGKCFHCGKTGHWKRNCPIYLEDVKKAKAVGASVSGIYVIDVHMSTSSSWVLDTGCGSHICTSVQGLHMRRTLAKGDVDLRVGNGARVASLAVGTYVLSLPSMLRTAEGNMKKGGSKSVLMVREAKGKGKKVAKSKGNGKTKPKGKEALKPKGGVSKDGKCFHCGKTGHWKRNCPIYLEDVKKAKAVGALVSGIYVIDVHMSTSSSWVLDTGCGSHICTSVQGLHMRRTLAKGDVDLRVGNGARVASLAVGTYVLSLPSMLRTAEGNMKKGGSKSVLMVREAKGKGKKVAKSKGNGKTKPKGKEALKPKGGVSKDGKCFHCGKTGHWKRNCPIYLEDVKKAKAVGALVSGTAHEKDSS